MRVLIFGGNGWLGKYITSHLKDRRRKGPKNEVLVSEIRVDADAERRVLYQLREFQPTHVICLIGRTRGPGYNTIDYLEQSGKIRDNVRDNLLAPLLLSQWVRNFNDSERDEGPHEDDVLVDGDELGTPSGPVHTTYIGTGCIFGDGSDKTYAEDANPDFFGSSYSCVKGATDVLMREIFSDSVLNVRIRMPIMNEDHEYDFISKIVKYGQGNGVINERNSVTVWPTLIEPMVRMMKTCTTGTVNLVNPDPLTHHEMLDLYKRYCDPSYEYKSLTIADQDKNLDSKRSNNQLDARLMAEVYDVPSTTDALILSFKKRKDGVSDRTTGSGRESRTVGGRRR